MEPSTKRQRVYISEPASLENINRDILSVIINWVANFDDVTSLSMVCKRMDSVNCLGLLQTCEITHENKFTAATSNRIAQLTQLKELSIDTFVSDTNESPPDLLLKFTTLTQLQSMTIRVREIFIEDVEELFGSQSKLTSFSLSGFKSRSGEWRAFRYLTAVEQLNICNVTELHDLTPFALKLKRLALVNNTFEDVDAYEQISNLTNLTYFKFDENLPVENEMFDVIARMTALQELIVNQGINNFSFSADVVNLIAQNLTNLTRLSWTAVTTKDDSDAEWIPESISNLQRLRNLDLIYWGDADVTEKETNKISSLYNITHLGIIFENKQALDNLLPTLTGLKTLLRYGAYECDDEYIKSLLPNVYILSSSDFI